MSQKPTKPSEPARTLRDDLRAVRNRYDLLDRGARAVLRRARSADELVLEGTYWKVAGAAERASSRLADVVLLFPTASHVKSEKFSFGRHLRRQLGDSSGAVLRVRRVLDSRDRDELVHRLRGLLKLASASGASVDWGALGADILNFFHEDDFVRRRWAQDFYAPISDDTSTPTPST